MLSLQEKDKVAKSISAKFNKAGSSLPRLTVGIGKGVVVYTQRKLSERGQKQVSDHAAQVLGHPLEKDDLIFKVIGKVVAQGATRKK